MVPPDSGVFYIYTLTSVSLNCHQVSLFRVKTDLLVTVISVRCVQRDPLKQLSKNSDRGG